jgi:hypothetical protein
MFDKIQRSLGTFFSSKRLYVFAILIAILAMLQLAYSYADKFTTRDLMTSIEEPVVAPSPAITELPGPIAGNPMAPVANPTDLLPHDVNNQWGELNTLSRNSMNTPDLLQAGYHIGLDTVGQTLRNANLQERSDPIIPKGDTGPWNQSTIEADYARTPMEIGMGPR